MSSERVRDNERYMGGEGDLGKREREKRKEKDREEREERDSEMREEAGFMCKGNLVIFLLNC